VLLLFYDLYVYTRYFDRSILLLERKACFFSLRVLCSEKVLSPPLHLSIACVLAQIISVAKIIFCCQEQKYVCVSLKL